MTRRAKPDTFSFIQRVGIIASAFVTAGGIISWVASVLWSQATAPLIARIEAIQTSQRYGDSTLVRMIQSTREISYRQRLDLLDVLGYPPGTARDKRIESLREQVKEER